MEAGTALAPSATPEAVPRAATRREALARERAAMDALVRQRRSADGTAPTRREALARERAAASAVAAPPTPRTRREALALERAAAARQSPIGSDTQVVPAVPAAPATRREALAAERAANRVVGDADRPPRLLEVDAPAFDPTQTHDDQAYDASDNHASVAHDEPPRERVRQRHRSAEGLRPDDRAPDSLEAWLDLVARELAAVTDEEPAVRSQPPPEPASAPYAVPPQFDDLVQSLDTQDGYVPPGEREQPASLRGRARGRPARGRPWRAGPDATPGHRRSTPRRPRVARITARPSWPDRATTARRSAVGVGVLAAAGAGTWAYTAALRSTLATAIAPQDLVRHGALSVLLAVAVLVLRGRLRASGYEMGAVVVPWLVAVVPLVTTGATLAPGWAAARSPSTVWILAAHPGLTAIGGLLLAATARRRGTGPSVRSAVLGLGVVLALSAAAATTVRLGLPLALRLTQDDGLTLRAAVAGMLVTAALIGVGPAVRTFGSPVGRWFSALAATLTTAPATVSVAVVPTLLSTAGARGARVEAAQLWTLLLYPAGVVAVTTVAVALSRLAEPRPPGGRSPRSTSSRGRSSGGRVRTTGRVPQPG